MSDPAPQAMTGGCQCGALRFAFDGVPKAPHICHCRMCQKAVGGPFAALCPVPKASFRVTRGEIAWFRSSDVARRGFCRDCGTPLIFDYPADEGIGVMIGALDRPDLVAPAIQYGIESRVPWFGHLPALPAEETGRDDPRGYIPRIAATNRQHPDHDTAEWPPGPGEAAG